MLAQRPETFPGGTLRLVSQREFPISTTMTGALMRIKPGGLRELHWHPNADEWQYYLSGRARMTVFGSRGRARTEEFGAGDVGYVPRGYGHYIENVGTEDLELMLAFNNGHYQSISLTAWMAANPQLLLATNFGVPEAKFKRLPDPRAVYAGLKRLGRRETEARAVRAEGAQDDLIRVAATFALCLALVC